MIHLFLKGKVEEMIEELKVLSGEPTASGVVRQAIRANYAHLKEQQGKDVFEYSVFGSPQQKDGTVRTTKRIRRVS